MEYGFLSLVPALISISLAIFTAQVVPALLLGILVAYVILAQGDVFQALPDTLQAIVAIFSEAWVVKTILFSFLVGSLLTLTQVTGGIQGLIDFLTQKKQWIKTKKGALLLAYCIGLLVFIESSITILLSGSITRPISDKFGVSREKLAYICDSTSAPVCGLLPMNAWGATIMGAITAQIQAGLFQGNSIDLLIRSLPYQFYSWITLAFVFWIIYSGKDFGPMKKAEERAKKEGKLWADDAEPLAEEAIDIAMKKGLRPNLWRLILPIIVLILMVPFALWHTGQGKMMEGSGSTAVFWAVLAAIAVIFIQAVLVEKTLNLRQFMDFFYKGIGAMIPVGSILIFAFTIGHALGLLETGKYLSTIVGAYISAGALPALLFVTASIMAFATGTSFGTFSIMIPIGLQMAVPMEAHLPLVIGAVVSGGIFGDHCSPISDTTIMSSMVTGSDHIHHVRTQIPYALVSGILAIILFLIVGFLQK